MPSSSHGHRVLVVDDEPAVRRMLAGLLEDAGYAVFEADTGKSAIEAAKKKHIDIILLDLRLPDMTGVDVLSILREWSPMPVLMLSVENEEATIVEALDAGADDYLSKPFSAPELLARLRSGLRRGSKEVRGSVFEAGPLRVDLEMRTVMVGETEVALTPTEYDLLKIFINNAGRVLTHSYLLGAIWGKGSVEDVGVLRVNMCNLRRKIERSASGRRLLQTEPGVGYRLLCS